MLGRVPQFGCSKLIALACCLVAALAVPEALAQEGDEFAIATRLANAGQAAGYYRLGRVYELGQEVEKDLFEAARKYQIAAEQGHVEAQYSLGLILSGAVPDSPHNAGKSFNWFHKAADQDHPMAAYFVAMCFESGNGTQKSSELAFEWYRRAAMGGNGAAMNALARMYATGAGIRVNLPNAYAWNEVAAASGFEGAVDDRDKLEGQLSKAELVRAKKLARALLNKYAAPPGERP